eukprot:comp12679_c0_seq1/m.7770 comp12679_c0_seq1/g.7770  ORF comp12679_c0_seq1/g.7770 comp12679_c0_seq1/m.7770 type:complete len:265 (-) comp12679_c0_seq1:123-917(-)
MEGSSLRPLSVATLVQQVPPPSTTIGVQGRLIHRRALSKRLLFWTMCDVNEENESIDVVFKSQDVEGELTTEQLIDVRARLKAGDVVVVMGRWEGGEEGEKKGELVCTGEVVVVEEWKKLGKGTFVPRPGVKGGNKKDDKENNGVCKFFVNTGQCPRAQCAFLHPSGARGEAQNDWSTQRRAERRGKGEDDDPHLGTKQSHWRRTEVLANWLVSNFGRDRLSQGTGVLDVAGGAGALSFELHVIRHIPCTLVDPRREIGLSKKK